MTILTRQSPPTRSSSHSGVAQVLQYFSTTNTQVLQYFSTTNAQVL